jgi:L-lactate dehydrogenase complex protein LldF
MNSTRTTLRSRSIRAVNNSSLRSALRHATEIANQKRKESFAKLGDRAEFLKNLASDVRVRVLSDLGNHVGQFVSSARASGASVQVASNGLLASRMVADILKEHGVTRVIKSKSMITEEIDLNELLRKESIEAIETDLGEYIVQLAGEKPSHITAPAIHKSRQEIGRLFTEKLGVEYTDDPAGLTRMARCFLRAEFLNARAGITGANFLLADSGSVVLFTNEGNGRLVSAGPPVHIVVTSIDKVIPSINDLPPFIRLLPRSATGQQITSYISVVTGPHTSVGNDDKREVHIILLDNGRTRIASSECWEILKCIRCGACMNVCPVYRVIGGHAYGGTYVGPMGIILTAVLEQTPASYELLDACTLCGECAEVCPVRVPLPKLISLLRTHRIDRLYSSPVERTMMRLFGTVCQSPSLYRLTQRLLRVTLKAVPRRFLNSVLSRISSALPRSFSGRREF